MEGNLGSEDRSSDAPVFVSHPLRAGGVGGGGVTTRGTLPGASSISCTWQRPVSPRHQWAVGRAPWESVGTKMVKGSEEKCAEQLLSPRGLGSRSGGQTVINHCHVSFVEEQQHRKTRWRGQEVEVRVGSGAWRGVTEGQYIWLGRGRPFQAAGSLHTEAEACSGDHHRRTGGKRSGRGGCRALRASPRQLLRLRLRVTPRLRPFLARPRGATRPGPSSRKSTLTVAARCDSLLNSWRLLPRLLLWCFLV